MSLYAELKNRVESIMAGPLPVETPPAIATTDAEFKAILDAADPLHRAAAAAKQASANLTAAKAQEIASRNAVEVKEADVNKRILEFSGPLYANLSQLHAVHAEKLTALKTAEEAYSLAEDELKKSAVEKHAPAAAAATAAAE